MNNEALEKALPLILFRIMVVFMFLGSLYGMFVFCNEEKEFVVGGLGVLCLGIVSTPMLFRRDYRLFEPLTFVIMLVTFGTTFKILYILSQGDDNLYVVRRLLNHQRVDVFVYGMSLACVGWACFLVGYAMKFRTPILSNIYCPNRNEWYGSRLQIVLIGLSVVSLLFFIGFVVMAGVNFSSLETLSQKRFSDSAGSAQNRMYDFKYYFYRGAALSKFVVYLTLLWMLHRKQPIVSWIGAWFVFALVQTCFLSFMISNRAGIVLLLIDCMVIAYFMRQKLELRKVAMVFGLVFALLIPILASRDKSDHTFMTLIEKTMAGRDLLDISKTCHIINAVPEKMEYRNGEMIYGWLAAPIPRSIWPDKPMWAERGPFINQRVFGDKVGLSGVPPGFIGESYWNFGFLGVWGGLFIMGILLRQLFEAFLPYSTNPTCVLIYTMIVTRFGMFALGNDLGTGIVKAGLDLVPILAILWFISFHQPVQETTRNRPVSNSGNAGGKRPRPSRRASTQAT